jgi:hypothetical protein
VTGSWEANERGRGMKTGEEGGRERKREKRGKCG